jgi:hypothetical protein
MLFTAMRAQETAYHVLTNKRSKIWTRRRSRHSTAPSGKTDGLWSIVSYGLQDHSSGANISLLRLLP